MSHDQLIIRVQVIYKYKRSTAALAAQSDCGVLCSLVSQAFGVSAQRSSRKPSEGACSAGGFLTCWYGRGFHFYSVREETETATQERVAQRISRSSRPHTAARSPSRPYMAYGLHSFLQKVRQAPHISAPQRGCWLAGHLATKHRASGTADLQQRPTSQCVHPISQQIEICR